MSVLLGLLGLVTLPIAVAFTERADSLSLLEAGYAIPVALVLSLGGVFVGRKVRRRQQQTLTALEGAGTARVGRTLGYVALYLALTAALAVGFFGILNYVSA